MPQLRGISSEFRHKVFLEKLEWWRYERMKEFDDIFTRFNATHKRGRQMKEHRLTDSIGRACAAILNSLNENFRNIAEIILIVSL